MAKIWAQERTKEGDKVDCQRVMPLRGFWVLSRRWVVAWTFSWLGRTKRSGAEGALDKALGRVAETAGRLQGTRPWRPRGRHPGS